MTPCTNCGKELIIKEPIIEIVNQLSFSALVVNHAVSAGLKCIHCEQIHVMAIQGFDMAALKLLIMKLPDSQAPTEANLIVMPNGRPH